jgi:phosphotransferase system IIA component
MLEVVAVEHVILEQEEAVALEEAVMELDLEEVQETLEQLTRVVVEVEEPLDVEAVVEQVVQE